MCENSSANVLRMPSAVFESRNPPLVTNAMTPRSLIRRMAHLMARM